MSNIHIFAKKKTELTALDRNGLHLKMKKLSELNIEKPLTVGDKKKSIQTKKMCKVQGDLGKQWKEQEGFCPKICPWNTYGSLEAR